MLSWNKVGPLIILQWWILIENDIMEVLGSTAGALVPFQKAALKWAWAKCQQNRETPPNPSAATAVPQSDTAASSSWTESFAPKLTSGVVASLKSTFKKNYPAEILTAENTPSLRLLSMVHHQHAKKDHKWIPWKFRLSQQKSDEISASKSETLSLHSMILDDPPTIEIANGGLGLHTLRSLFETYSIAMAMVGVAHLASLKDYYLRFLSFMSTRLDTESGLRNPSMLEAQSADKTLMGVVCDLVAERGWSWDDSLHEVTHIRSEMASLLQPRPRQLNPPLLAAKEINGFDPIEWHLMAKVMVNPTRVMAKKERRAPKDNEWLGWQTSIKGGSVISCACDSRQASVLWITADSNIYAQSLPETAKHVGKITGLFNMSPQLTDLRISPQFHKGLAHHLAVLHSQTAQA